MLTVKAKTPGAHREFGWEKFTDAVIEKILGRIDANLLLLKEYLE